jgi:hypothetical protein
MGKPAPIRDRIADAIKSAGGRIQYYHLARAVFPEDQYPRAWAYPTKGGPPGCYMALSSAIRRYGFSVDYHDARNVVHSHVMLGRQRPDSQ